VYTTLERHSIHPSCCWPGVYRILSLDIQRRKPVFCQNRHPDLARLGDEAPIVRATRLAATRGEVRGKGAGGRGELRPHAHMAERAAEPPPRLGRHRNRRFHKGMDLAMIGKRAGFRKSETVDTTIHSPTRSHFFSHCSTS
jgi:hypothetical protein